MKGKYSPVHANAPEIGQDSGQMYANAPDMGRASGQMYANAPEIGQAGGQIYRETRVLQDVCTGDVMAGEVDGLAEGVHVMAGEVDGLAEGVLRHKFATFDQSGDSLRADTHKDSDTEKDSRGVRGDARCEEGSSAQIVGEESTQNACIHAQNQISNHTESKRVRITRQVEMINTHEHQAGLYARRGQKGTDMYTKNENGRVRSWDHIGNADGSVTYTNVCEHVQAEATDDDTETRIYDEFGLAGRKDVDVGKARHAPWKSKSFSEGSKEGVYVCVYGSICAWMNTCLAVCVHG